MAQVEEPRPKLLRNEGSIGPVRKKKGITYEKKRRKSHANEIPQ